MTVVKDDAAAGNGSEKRKEKTKAIADRVKRELQFGYNDLISGMEESKAGIDYLSEAEKDEVISILKLLHDTALKTEETLRSLMDTPYEDIYVTIMASFAMVYRLPPDFYRDIVKQYLLDMRSTCD